MNIDASLVLTGIIVPIVSAVIWLMWSEIKDMRRKQDDMQSKVASQEQLLQMERRIMESVGNRIEDMNDKLDLLIGKLIKDK